MLLSLKTIQIYQASWLVQEEVVKLHSRDWIEQLYFEQFLVNENKNQEKSDGRKQVKRKDTEYEEGDRKDSK